MCSFLVCFEGPYNSVEGNLNNLHPLCQYGKSQNIAVRAVFRHFSLEMYLLRYRSYELLEQCALKAPPMTPSGERYKWPWRIYPMVSNLMQDNFLKSPRSTKIELGISIGFACQIGIQTEDGRGRSHYNERLVNILQFQPDYQTYIFLTCPSRFDRGY